MEFCRPPLGGGEGGATRDHQRTRHAHARPTEWWSAWGGRRYNAWRSGAPGRHAHGNAARQVVHGRQTPSNDPRNNQHNPRYANYWALLTNKRHPPHPAQPRHTNHWAPRTRKRHQQEHRPQRPTERSDPTQHAKGRPGDCPGPRKGTATRRNVTRGGGILSPPSLSPSILSPPFRPPVALLSHILSPLAVPCRSPVTPLSPPCCAPVAVAVISGQFPPPHGDTVPHVPGGGGG